MTIDTVPTAGGVRCKVSALTFQHLCPVKDEVDRGKVTLEWTTTNVTLELHSLAEYLRGWAEAAITHEAICDRIARSMGLPRSTVDRWAAKAAAQRDAA